MTTKKYLNQQQGAFPSDVVTLRGSKSYTNRGLVIGAITNGDVTLKNVAEAEDSALLSSALWQMGFLIKPEATHNGYTIGGHTPKNTDGDTVLNCGAGGTVARFLLSLCAVTPGTWVLRGTERLHQRPMGALITALRQLGASITCMEADGCLPVRIHGKPLKGGVVQLDASASSQFLTSLMLIGPAMPKGIEVRLNGALASSSYVNMTLSLMNHFGIRIVKPTPNIYRVPAGSAYQPKKYTVEPDLTGAGYLLGLAMLCGQTVTLGGIKPGTEQADVKLAYAFEMMGGTLQRNVSEATLTLTGPADGKIHPLVHAPMEMLPDSIQTLAVVAAFADGLTEITGIRTLKHKETDRVAAIITELGKMGIEAFEAKGDRLVVRGDPAAVHGAEIETYDDHRMAMAFALAAARLDDMVILDPMCVGKSFPSYWHLLEQFGVTSL